MKAHPVEPPVATLMPDFARSVRAAVKDALDVQNASNLSGILLTWARHQAILKEVCGGNNDRYHKHPVNIMFLSKVTSLMGVNADCLGGVDGDLKSDSYTYCQENAR